MKTKILNMPPKIELLSKMLSLFLLCLIAPLFSEEPLLLSFQELQNGNLSPNNNQLIEIRGFLYQDPTSSRWILAAEPNLRTCCIGSRAKANSQIVLPDDFSTTPSHAAVTIRGVLYKDGDIYRFKKASITSQPKSATWTIIWLLIPVLCLISFYYKKRKNKMGAV